MLTLRHHLCAPPGKEAELRDFMADWIAVMQGQGDHAGLSQRILSSEGPLLVVRRVYRDMAALDETRRANEADPAWQARVAKLATMIREPVRDTLEEILVPPVGVGGAFGLVQRTFVAPVLDKVSHVRSILEAYVRGQHAAGYGRSAVGRQIFNETGPTFVVTASHASLTELAQRREQGVAADQTLLAALGDSCRAPLAVQLLEVVVRPQRSY